MATAPPASRLSQTEDQRERNRCQYQNDRLPFHLTQLVHVHLHTQQCDTDAQQPARAEIDAGIVAAILRQVVERHPHQKCGENDGATVVFLYKTCGQIKRAAEGDAGQQGFDGGEWTCRQRAAAERVGFYVAHNGIGSPLAMRCR